MPKNNEDLDYLEVASQRRRDVLLVILVIASIICIAMFFNRQSQINKLESDIKDKEHKKTEMVAHNKKIDEKQKEIDREVGLEDVQSQAETFDKNFFNWNSWGEFTDNMKALQKEFPNLKDSKVVDISGKEVGKGESPKSSYSDEAFTTKNKGELAQLITQSKKTPTTQSEKLWLKMSNTNNTTYEITKMKPYKEIEMDYRGGH